MRRILILAFMLSLTLVPVGVGSPTDGSWTKFEDIKSSAPWQTTKTFLPGERACVIAIGTNTQVGTPKLRIAVYNEKGALVATDESSSTLVGNYTALMWYPPRRGTYRIEVRSSVECETYIAIK